MKRNNTIFYLNFGNWLYPPVIINTFIKYKNRKYNIGILFLCYYNIAKLRKTIIINIFSKA